MASERDVRGRELPIAPGQVYIEVEYDYQYKSKERQICIQQGERYMLVKKTNGDWWQVKKDEATKAFYVPAQYVREVRKALMPPPKPLPLGHHAGVTGGNSVQVKPSASSENAGSLKDLDKAAVEIIHPHGCDTLPRARASSPELRRDPLDIDMAAVHCDSEGSERRYDSSGDELSSSSTEHLQAVFPSGNGGRSESPVYTNLQELKISGSNLPPAPSTSPLHVHGDWETHKDQSGRHYYHNRSTQERTWKPPRAREASTGSRGDPHGNSTGEAEVWIYWDLDEHGHILYSRSLDRKQVEPIVLSKWRHSTYVLDTNDKVRCPPDRDRFPSEKCGILNVTKITEHGKKVRKSWMSSWAVLHSSTLLFAKGQGGGTSWFGVGQSKPEFTVDLRGGSIEWASKEKSSKKHVIELKTRQGTELLIQSDAESIISDWYRALLDTISTHAWESDEAIEEDMPESPGAEKQDREKDHKMTKAIKPSTSMDTSENKKTKHKLKKFLTRRPTLQTVRDKGYIKDQVFGCSLGVLCQRENSSVPSFVMMCIDHVENNALNVDGLYRVSGNLAVIQKLRFAVNHDEKVDLEDGKWEDIHVITGALKMFFRELPEPLFTYGLFQDFVNAIKIPDYKLRVQSIKELVKQLPRPNQDTMQVLFKHLRKVIDYGEVNRMTTQSVAIVFGPTLLRPETETWNMAVHMVYQNQIVELILLEYEGIFR
uniref:Rho GTPase activating protein 12a n=1 Tax=Esox lucius TaxID=8010 RepID=A0AAY5L9J4_ESOLU